MSITIIEIGPGGTKQHLSLSEALSKYSRHPVATTDSDYPPENQDAQPDPPHPERPAFYRSLPRYQKRR